MGSDDGTVIKIFLGGLSAAFSMFLAHLARDWTRDKKFSAIREEQQEHFTCKLSSDKAESERLFSMMHHIVETVDKIERAIK